MNQSYQNLHSRLINPSFIAVLLLSFFALFATPVPVAAQDPLEASVKQGLLELHDAINRLRPSVAGLASCAKLRANEVNLSLVKVETSRKAAEIKYNQALALDVNDSRLKNLREKLLAEALENITEGKNSLAGLESAIKLALEALLSGISRQRNNVGELLLRAEQTVIGSGNRQAERLVYQAKKFQGDADQAVLRRNFCYTLSAYNSAINLLMDALKAVEGRRPMPDATPEMVIAREKERFENLAKRAGEAVETSKNSAALSVLEQAQKQARAAEEAFRKGEIVVAQQLYGGATRLLLRAIDLAMVGQKDRDFGRNEIALLQGLVQTAAQEINAGADPRASLLLQRARGLLNEAEAALGRQQPQEVKWRIELARNFVDKAMRKADRGAVTAENFAQRFNEALQVLARDIAEVGAKARDANKAEAQQLVELATNAYQAAENAGRQNRLVIGFQLIRMAQHFLLRAETLLRDSTTPNAANLPARETVLQRLTLLESALQEIPNEGGAESCETVRMQVAELIKRGRAALERDQIRLAIAITEVANDLIENCLNK